MSLLVLMRCQVDGVARKQDNTSGIALNVIGIATCLIGEALPGRAIRRIVVLRASKDDDRQQTANDGLLNFEFTHLNYIRFSFFISE